MAEARCKVSVIVPIYKAEKHIKRCVQSLFGQTLDEMEFIFVDDCSPDDSVQILETALNNFPKRKAQVKILRHEENKGPASARNTGLNVATGEYVCYCDSDDWVELDMYNQLYNTAKSAGCDICWCDFYVHMPNKKEYCKALDVLPNKVQMLRAHIMYGWTVAWNMLVKRDLYKKWQVRGYEGYNFCEDYGLTVRLLYYASTIAHLPMALYHYDRTNMDSLVMTSLDKRRIDRVTNDQVNIYCLINDFFKERGLYELLKEVLSYRILCGKRGWLMNKNKRDEYRRLCPEANAYIWSNPLCSTKDKICQTIIMRPSLCFLLPIIQILSELITKWKK